MTRLGRTALALTVLAVALVPVVGASARPATGAGGNSDIVQTAQQAGSFKTLLALATRAGLADDLATGEVTLLAPTDAAFRKVPRATLRAVQRNPRLLRRVLLYHVVPGRVPSSTVVTLRSAKTLAGPAVKVRVAGRRVFVNNARVTKVDVAASNGVIHVIDRVLIPPAR
jgi:transforming growth factor-beta-induced protein